MEKLIKYCLFFILIFNSITAIYGGLNMIFDPSGVSLQLDSNTLNGVFSDYFLPGIALFLFLGVGSIIVTVLFIKKHNIFPLSFITLGIFNIIWILVQITVINQLHFLQLVYIILGIVFIIFGLMNLKKI